MAARLVFQKKLLKTISDRHFFFSRPLNSSTAASSSSPTASSISINLTTEKPEPITNIPNSSSLNLNDVEKIFSAVPTTKLLRASANLHMAAMEPIVDFGTWVMKSKLMDMEVVRDIVMGFVRHTFYEHFCAGEDALGTQNTVQKLYRGGDGLRTMLVYAVEYASDNVSCDRNLEAFLQTVETAKSLPPSSVSFPLLFTHTQCFFCLLLTVTKFVLVSFPSRNFFFVFCFIILLFLAFNTNLGAHLSTRSLQQVRVI